ncbi:MAG: squalene synthase HpnC [Alphaproteobacteria bacterium]|nr:squalene synthase HpnC [Alphaproteobacteria bacterium]
MSRSAAAVLLPSPTGKTAVGENFPVASRLLAPAVRAQVMAFYRFARLADDIADDPALAPDQKLARLDALEQSLAGGAPMVDEAVDLRDAVGNDPALLAHAAALLQAFRRDAFLDQCRDWGDLMAYCRFSAAPVGRFLLDLHGEGAATHAPSDALCASLQILNHLQDCGADYQTLGRVYLPADWMEAAGAVRGSLAHPTTSPELRDLLDHVLDQVDGLIDLASALPGRINNRRLRLEAAVTVAVARRLSALLRRHDPLAEPVRLTPLAYGVAVVEGLISGLQRR